MLFNKTVEGELIQITDSAGQAPVAFQVQGKTEQKQLTGKNLCDSSSGIETNNYILSPVMALAAGTYTASCAQPSTANQAISYIIINGSSKSGDGTKATFTLENAAQVQFQCNFYNNADPIGVAGTNLKNTIMVESGSTATEYEPYCGSTAEVTRTAPNPDYPQPIQCVKEGTQVKVCGKNLFSVGSVADYEIHGNMSILANNDGINVQVMPYAESNCFKKDHISVKQNKNISISCGCETRILVRLFDDMGNVLSGGISSGIYNQYYNAYYNDAAVYSFSIISDKVSYVQIGFSAKGEPWSWQAITDIQVEYGLVPTGFQPYSEQVLETPCDLYEGDVWYPLEGGVRKINGVIESYNGEDVGEDYISTTGELTAGATVVYALAEPIIEQYDPQTFTLPQKTANIIQEQIDLLANMVVEYIAEYRDIKGEIYRIDQAKINMGNWLLNIGKNVSEDNKIDELVEIAKTIDLGFPIKYGTFVPSTNLYDYTITHNLGIVPNFALCLDISDNLESDRTYRTHSICSIENLNNEELVQSFFSEHMGNIAGGVSSYEQTITYAKMTSEVWQNHTSFYGANERSIRIRVFNPMVLGHQYFWIVFGGMQ